MDLYPTVSKYLFWVLKDFFRDIFRVGWVCF